MKKLKLLFAACALYAGWGNYVYAQTADVYFPSVIISNVSDELSEATTVDVGNFSALSDNNYTIEVTGTSGTQIVFPYDRYRSASYTPTVSGTIRFVKTEDNIFVYEKESTQFVYKGKAEISSVTWPAMETGNVSDATNILGNPDFQAVGELIATDKYKLGSPWQISDASVYGPTGFRQGKNANSHDNGVASADCFVWRTDNSGTGYKDKYFYQEVTLNPNSKYKFRIRVSQNTNGPGKYSVRLGSTTGGKEYADANIIVAKNNSAQVYTGDLTTTDIDEHCYFSIYNAENYNNSSNNACTQIDLIQLVEATTAPTTISGVSTAKYVVEAVSPICEGNVTARISNPFIENGTSGWINGRTNNGQQYTNAPGGTYMDTYNDTRDQYQEITLPAGVYTIKAATRAIATLQVGYIYAQVDGNKIGTADVHKDGNTGGALGNGWGWTETTFVVPVDDTKVRIGFYAECGGNLWAGADEFYLTYKGKTLPSDICTSLLSEVVDGKMNSTVASTQNSAKVDFEQNETLANYYALRVAINNATASVAAYAKGKAAIDKANDILSKTNVYTAEAYTTFSEAVAVAESKYADNSWIDSEATSFATSTLGNGHHSTASVDDFLISAWDVAARNWDSYHVNTWSTVDDSGNPNLVVPAIEYWGSDANSLADKTMTATVAVEPYETYTISAFLSMAKNSTAYGDDATTAPVGVTLQVGDGLATTCTGSRVGETRFFEGAFEATGEADSNGNLTIKISTATTDASWIMFRDVKYTKQPAAEATAEEKAALLATISAAKANVIGFEAGEYAPYNNIDAMATLATAENVYANSTTKPAINGTKDALQSATWTVNQEELNAFYDGTFSTRKVQETSQNDTKIPGWTSGNNIRQILKTVATYPGLADATDGTALFAWSGGASYGNDEGYEMPLKANSIYKLSLKVAGWNNETRGNITVSVKNGDDGMAAIVIGKADKDIKGNNTNIAGMTPMEILFVTGAAGNYIFSLSSTNNIVFSDVELKKATNQYLEFADNADIPKYAPGVYPTVKITRTLTAGRWATAVYPFAVSGVDNIAVLDSYDADNGSIGFATAEASTANEPFLMRSTAGTTTIELSDVAVVTAANPVVTKGNAKLVGTYVSTSITNDNVNYVLSNNVIYPVGTAGADLDPYRAYIQVASVSGSARGLKLFIDGETTGIDDIMTEGQLNGKIYNLNGQQVEKAQNGLYIMNGKKVMVK